MGDLFNTAKETVESIEAKRREGSGVERAPVAPGKTVILQPHHLRNFDWETVKAVSPWEPATATWPEDDRQLLAWFEEAVNYLPDQPFDLSPFERVVDPPAFYEAQILDVRKGPRGPRSRTGALQADLRKLHDRFKDARPEQHPKRQQSLIEPD